MTALPAVSGRRRGRAPGRNARLGQRAPCLRSRWPIGSRRFGSYCCCSVGRMRISLTATCRGRVTMYSIASAISVASSRCMRRSAAAVPSRISGRLVLAELGGYRPGLDERYPKMELGHFLAADLCGMLQTSALGGVVCPLPSRTCRPATEETLTRVSDVARSSIGRVQQMR